MNLTQNTQFPQLNPAQAWDKTDHGALLDGAADVSHVRLVRSDGTSNTVPWRPLPDTVQIHQGHEPQYRTQRERFIASGAPCRRPPLGTPAGPRWPVVRLALLAAVCGLLLIACGGGADLVDPADADDCQAQPAAAEGMKRIPATPCAEASK